MSAERRIRVLVVEDSAFARKVLRETLKAEPDLEVVDTARDGLEALEKIQALQPDVVTLDLVMPHLDGVGVLRALSPPAGPRVVVVSTSPAESELGAEALELGAVELVQKPTALATDRLYELGQALVRAVRAAFAADPSRRPTRSPPAVPPTGLRRSPQPSGTRFRIVCVGTSTGGPPALTQLLGALPADLRVPVAVVLHIPPGYTEAIARRLDALSPLHVVEVSEGLRLTPGMVGIAPGGQHLTVRREGELLVARLAARPLDTPHRPSVDVLFESASAAVGDAVLGVVLTGMGDDGLAGARQIRAAGGAVLTEARETCVVYGMPRTVAEAGLSDGQVPLDLMAEAIHRRLG